MSKQSYRWGTLIALSLIAGLASACGSSPPPAPVAPPPPPPAPVATNTTATLQRIDGIVLMIHNSALDQVPAAALVDRLKASLTVPIEVTSNATDITTALNESRKQFFSPQVVHTAYEWRWAQDRKFRILIIKDDMYDDPLNYIFSDGRRELRTAVISLARLRGKGEVGDTTATPEQVTERLTKLVLKMTGRTAGLDGEGCVLSFAKSLDGLDSKPAGYCADDAAQLTASGLLRPGQAIATADVAAEPAAKSATAKPKKAVRKKARTVKKAAPVPAPTPQPLAAPTPAPQP